MAAGTAAVGEACDPRAAVEPVDSGVCARGLMCRGGTCIEPCRLDDDTACAAETTAAIEAHGREAHAVRAHFGKDGSVEKVAEAAREKLGRVDIFVHNAASGVLKPAVELSERHWDWTHRINARSFFFLVQNLLREDGCARLMGDGGRIVALSSLGRLISES